MRRYEIKESVREVKYKERKEIKAGCTLDKQHIETVIASFTNKEEALEALSLYRTSIRELTSASEIYFEITEYYVEENEYEDEENGWESLGVYEFSRMEIALIEKPGYTTIGMFDNYTDAEAAYDDYDGENEVYIAVR